LEDNGFRAGVVGGLLPDRFRDLLTSERTNPAPHQWRRRAGDAKLLALGPARPQCRFQLVQNGRPQPVALEHAECGLVLTPELDPDGGVRLTVVPQVQYGPRTLWPQPAADGGWAVQPQRPAERYPALAFEVTLTGPEYLVVGPRFDKPQTLGYACFVSADGPKPVQRLVAVRAGRAADDGVAGPAAPGAPLAAQATTAVRGYRP
jgi:hypothetical protein